MIVTTFPLRLQTRSDAADVCRTDDPASLYRFAVVDDRRGIKKQRIVRFCEVDHLSESGRRDIADIDKRDLGIACGKKRCYTAAERIPENDQPTFLRNIRICDPDDRACAAEEHFIRISACGSAEIINGNVRRRFGVIHFKVPYHGVIEIEKPLRCVREGCLTVIDAVKRNTRVMLSHCPIRSAPILSAISSATFSILSWRQCESG